MLVLGIAVLLAAGLVIVLQSVVDAVRGFSHDLPGLIENARQSDLGGFINDGSNSLDFLKQHAGDITSGLGNVSGGAASCRGVRVRCGDGRLRGHLPDPLRTDRRAPGTRLDRKHALSGQVGAL